jgi:hypothetical protein
MIGVRAAAAVTGCGRVRGRSMTRSASEAGSESREWEDARGRLTAKVWRGAGLKGLNWSGYRGH